MTGRGWMAVAAAALAPLPLAGCAKGPSAVVERFVRAAAAGDTAKALDDFDPEVRQVGGMKLVAALGQAADKARAHGGLRDLAVTAQSSSGDAGSATVRETFGDGTVTTDTEKVRRVDGRWFVTI